MSYIANGLIQFEKYEIDRAQWQLSWGDEPLQLNRKTFDLLLYLIDHRERVVGKEELLQALWPEQFIEESNLTQHIFLLRKTLSRHDSDLKIIETVPGRGYRFTAPVTEPTFVSGQLTIGATESITRILFEEEQEDTEVQSLAERNQSRNVSGSSSRRVLLVTAAAATVIALATAGWFGWQHWLDRSGGAPVQVVLAPMEGTTGDAILDKSLTQALRMDLAQSPYVSVVPGSTVRATLAQMMHKPEEVMTPAMAREVCERTNSQGVLSGNVAKVGQHFLITEEASNCVDGSVVAAAKYEADKPEDLPGSIDKIAASLRRKLGESRRSITRFDTPLVPMNTASLEALKDYTQASILVSQGKWADAIPLQKQALQLDPNFAAARYDLAASYLSTGDFVSARPALLKAYEIRNTASQPVRLAITALYDAYSTQDLFAAETNYRSWTELYPRSAQAWNGLSVVQRDLGHHADSAASGLKVLALLPNNQGMYENAAFEQMRSGDIQGARATLDSAITHKLDGDRIRENYVEIALLLHDSALLQTQLAWIDAHPEASYSRMLEVGIAIGEGRFADAHRLLQQGTTLLRQQGLSGFADAITKNVGANLIEAGDREAGIRIFRSVPVDPEAGDDLEGLVDAGDFKTAEADLRAVRTKYPQATVWQHYYGPRVEAGIALANHHPQQAIAIMEAARPLDERDLDMHKFRGDAYLAAGQPSLAEKEYRAVVTHHEIDPELGDYPLSWLGLGEALAAEGNRAAAIDAYQHFLTLWAHADPDAMYLKQARQEFAALQTAPSVK
jgi:DNA-binding winged helix-turn-helix (wHTH) protein/tetratricopeptide (TPR) repeat protein